MEASKADWSGFNFIEELHFQATDLDGEPRVNTCTEAFCDAWLEDILVLPLQETCSLQAKIAGT